VSAVTLGPRGCGETISQKVSGNRCPKCPRSPGPWVWGKGRDGRASGHRPLRDKDQSASSPAAPGDPSVGIPRASDWRAATPSEADEGDFVGSLMESPKLEFRFGEITTAPVTVAPQSVWRFCGLQVGTGNVHLGRDGGKGALFYKRNFRSRNLETSLGSPTK